MLKMGICWCKLGVISQCTAKDTEQQEICDFYSSSINAHRCMHLNEDLNNHCWSQKAQKFSAEYGVRDVNNPAPVADKKEEEELCIDDFIDEAPEGKFDGKRCDNCILYACSYVVHENQQASSRGGLTLTDLEKIANWCPDYCDEEMMSSSISQSLRGIKP